MSEGYQLAFLIVLCLLYGKLCGVRNQMARIADFCERSEKRIKAQSGEPA
jgi:hypothetical protein